MQKKPGVGQGVPFNYSDSPETHIKCKNKERLGKKGYKKITMHSLSKKAGKAMQLDKIDFKIIRITRD